LYFLWSLCCLGLLSRAVDENGSRWLLAAAAAAGLASLTRYAGLSLLATGALALLLLESRPLGGRLRRGASFALMAGLPPVAWQIRNWLVAGTPTNRTLLFHPPAGTQLREAASTLAAWLPYPQVSAEVRLVVLGLGALTAVVFVAQRGRGDPAVRSAPAWRMIGLTVLHAAVYLTFLLVSLTFLDASTRLRDRILSPVFLVTVLEVASMLALCGGTRGRGARIAALGCLALLAVPYAIMTMGRIRESQAGLGFVGTAWRESETLARTRQLPADLQLYSNEAFPIYYLAERPTSWVPERIDPVKGTEREGYQRELAAMHARIDSGEAALILFHPQSLPPELPTLEELMEGRQPTLLGDDGFILLGPAEAGR
jgi:4-amino-4-deoxy-L-arabinose transferase-like glycosyltransferase